MINLIKYANNLSSLRQKGSHITSRNTFRDRKLEWKKLITEVLTGNA
jgi:hypothetical protein